MVIKNKQIFILMLVCALFSSLPLAGEEERLPQQQRSLFSRARRLCGSLVKMPFSIARGIISKLFGVTSDVGYEGFAGSSRRFPADLQREEEASPPRQPLKKVSQKRAAKKKKILIHADTKIKPRAKAATHAADQKDGKIAAEQEDSSVQSVVYYHSSADDHASKETEDQEVFSRSRAVQLREKEIDRRKKIIAQRLIKNLSSKNVSTDSSSQAWTEDEVQLFYQLFALQKQHAFLKRRMKAFQDQKQAMQGQSPRAQSTAQHQKSIRKNAPLSDRQQQPLQKEKAGRAPLLKETMHHDQSLKQKRSTDPKQSFSEWMDSMIGDSAKRDDAYEKLLKNQENGNNEMSEQGLLDLMQHLKNTANQEQEGDEVSQEPSRLLSTRFASPKDFSLVAPCKPARKTLAALNWWGKPVQVLPTSAARLELTDEIVTMPVAQAFIGTFLKGMVTQDDLDSFGPCMRRIAILCGVSKDLLVDQLQDLHHNLLLSYNPISLLVTTVLLRVDKHKHLRNAEWAAYIAFRERGV